VTLNPEYSPLLLLAVLLGVASGFFWARRTAGAQFLIFLLTVVLASLALTVTYFAIQSSKGPTHIFTAEGYRVGTALSLYFLFFPIGLPWLLVLLVLRFKKKKST
jgi:hypothetical protein